MKNKEAKLIERKPKLINLPVRKLVLVAFTLTFASFVTPTRSSAQSPAPAQAGAESAATCQVRWYGPNGYGAGSNPTIAIDGGSRFFVEIHERGALTYRLGRANSFENPELGPVETVQIGGDTPGVAMNADGLLIEVHKQYSVGAVNNLVYYRLGKVDLSGSVNQKIAWSSPAYPIEGGQYPQVAINDLGRVVEVHESNNLTNHKLYYNLGYADKVGENYYMSWDKLQGTEYNTGRRPHITIDNQGNVIEVHQAVSNNDLHYRRGRIVNGSIQWTAAPPNGRYETGNGRLPSVAQNGAGFVLEAHQTSANNAVRTLYGQVNANISVIDWTNPGVTWTNAANVAVSTSGPVAIAAYTNPENQSLSYRLGEVNCP